MINAFRAAPSFSQQLPPTPRWRCPLWPPRRNLSIRKAFAEAHKTGKPIFVGVHASWCPTCKAQDPILGELMSAPKFKDLVYFVVDFDGQKDAVKSFGVRTQSTLIAFKGDKETGRSVGDTNRSSIAALLDKTL